VSRRATRTASEPRSGGRWFALVLGVAIGAVGSWAAFRHAKAPQAPPPSVLTAKDHDALDEFVKRYFSTWSARDIDGYGRCFHPNARVWFGTASSMALPDFLEMQARAHADSPVRLAEDPLSWEGNVNNGLAHVRVHWELHRGTQNVRGYDYFTLVLSESRWKIMALIFNQE